nr:YodL domain-containing protein [uncultured Acetatifactor sp.]
MADARTEKQKVKEITDRLEEGLKELFEGEKYKSYLNTMSKFHNYSANNIQLIEMQCPDATYVAGYKAWQRNFERHVNKGERGIRILAPAPYKIKEEQEKIDPVTNEPVLDRDGMPVMEEVEIKIPAFRVVTVFDYSQTDGKELPGLGVNELHGNVERYQDFMEALERVSPVPIRYEEMEGDRKGYFIDLSRPIAIKEGMSEAQTAKTGVHEVAHAKLHAREAEQDAEKAVYKDRETKEVEAESIAYTVCQHFGIDTSDYSFGYIAGWSSGKEMPELKSSLDTIRRTSSELIKGIETQLLEIEKERAAEQSQEDIILLVSNTDRSEYDLLNVKGMERTEIFNLLSAMKDDDRQNVEAYLERAGAWVTLLANERSEEVGEYHLDYAYDTDTHEITDYKALQEERKRANVPIEYGDVIVRISTPDSGEYETIKIADMQSEVANVLYAIPFLEENEWNGNVLDYLQERGFEFVPIMRSGGLNDGYPQFYDFDVDMSEWEVHTASELPATVQAEQLINRMEFHRSVYDSDERNLIMNHAYRLDDMYKTTSLAHSIAEQKDDSALLWETIRVAQEEIDALPDGMVGLSEMHEYGYSWDEMLPLTKDMASELFGEDVSVYQLHADGSETLVEDRAALQEHDGLFGVEKGDWNAYKEYLSMKQELEDSEPNREAQLLYGNEGRFGIYQLKDSAETRDIRFMDMDYLEKEGIPVSRENYTLVYTGELTEGMSLEDIYTKFNIDHPADFTGHSLSVSDVVVLHQDGENTSHYVDSVGYREIPEFTKELSVSVEISTEKDAVREETAEIPAEAAEEHTAAENTMAEPDNDKVSYYVIEDLSTWAENSPEKSRLERFESLPEAMAKFTEYRGKETEDKPDMARATLGFSVNGSEFDLIHVRNHENCLSLDFTHSKAAVESSRFMEDLQTLNHEVGFDKVRVHREMSPEEIKDFVKQRFEYQLKSSGLDDISLYMDRFDALYGQGKMEHLMPTASQKHIVEDVPFTEWENPYIDTKSQTMGREETELAFRLADRYISIQEATEGYDYTIYDMNYRELDGGVYDNPDITIRQALDEIVTDLKEPMHRSELEGNIHTYDELIPIDYDELTEKAEQEAKHGIENRIRKEAEERKTVADFKARTEELFHGINGQTQEDIELNVYAYLQSKIDEYGMDIQLVDMAVSGSRCRGLEEAGSDLDVVVEYRGRESEDDLFNAFHEDGFTIGGVKVDINPITEGKTGTLGEYLPGVEAYLAEKRAALQEKAAEQAQEEKQTDRKSVV